MYHAFEDGWGLESNSAESCWLHQTSIWDKLCWDAESSSSCKLSPKKDIFLRPSLFGGGTPPRIQIVPSYAGNRLRTALYCLWILCFCLLVWLHCSFCKRILSTLLAESVMIPEGFCYIWGSSATCSHLSTLKYY